MRSRGSRPDARDARSGGTGCPVASRYAASSASTGPALHRWEGGGSRGGGARGGCRVLLHAATWRLRSPVTPCPHIISIAHGGRRRTVLLRHKRCRAPRLARAPRAADAVLVAVDLRRHVVIDDVRDVRDVEAAARDVRRDEHVEAAGLEGCGARGWRGAGLGWVSHGASDYTRTCTHERAREIQVIATLSTHGSFAPASESSRCSCVLPLCSTVTAKPRPSRSRPMTSHCAGDYGSGGWMAREVSQRAARAQRVLNREGGRGGGDGKQIAHSFHPSPLSIVRKLPSSARPMLSSPTRARTCFFALTKMMTGRSLFVSTSTSIARFFVSLGAKRTCEPTGREGGREGASGGRGCGVCRPGSCAACGGAPPSHSRDAAAQHAHGPHAKHRPFPPL